MSTIKKSLRKKQESSLPAAISQINRRLELLRSERCNLWGNDDNRDSDIEQYVQSNPKSNNTTYIILSDSDDEQFSSNRRIKNSKSRKESSSAFEESLISIEDHKSTSKCVTCLICSILTTLTPHNCCAKHLSLLIRDKNSDHNHQKQTNNTNQWPPQQVMIVPMTDDLIQYYVNPKRIYSLRAKRSTSPISKNSIASNRSSGKLSKKSTIRSELSVAERTKMNKSKVLTKSTHAKFEQPNSSSSINDSLLQSSDKTPQDVTYTVITSASTTTNSFESPNILDTCQLQQSSDEPIIIDDTQPDNQPENLKNNNTHENRQNDSHAPIRDETSATTETGLNRIEASSEDLTEFTPATARRTPTELMASRLPKIRLKKGRFRQGKPIANKNVPDTTTNECHSTTICQASPSTSTSTSIIIKNARPPSSLATIIEDESLIVQSTRPISEKSFQSYHVLSQRYENTTEGLSDTVMSCLFAQDESTQHDTIHTTTKTVPNHILPTPLPIIIEDYYHENQLNKSIDISQSSQLTNDQNDTQSLISSATNEKEITPTRISYRMNPDGTRVSISRPPLPTNHQLVPPSLRLAPTDIASTPSYTNKR